MPIPSQQQGTLYAIASGLCYGFIGYFGMTIINSGLSVLNMSFWRFFVSSLCMLILMLAQAKTTTPISKSSFSAFLFGMFFYGTSTIAYFIASKHIGTGLAMVTFFVFPAIVILLNTIFYRTKINTNYYFAFFVITLGMVLLADTSAFNFNVFGIGIGLLSALLYAIYIFASKRIQAISPEHTTFMVSTGCMLTALIAALADSSFYVPTGISIWFNIVIMALVCTALPILFLMQALKYISSEKAAMLSVLEPVFVVLSGIFMLGEKVTKLQTLGIFAILAGALMVIISGKKAMLIEEPETV